MDGMQSIIAVIFIALILVGGAIAASVASQSTATKYTNVTDTLQSDSIGTILETNNASEDYYYSDNATVVNGSSGNTLSDPSDYEWYNTNGTLKINSANAANTELNVTYDWWERSETEITATENIGVLLETGAWIPFMIIVALLMSILFTTGALA